MIVQTENSTYLLDLAARTVVRVRGDVAGELRRDGEPVSVLAFPHPMPEVGQPLVLWLQVREDGIPTKRTTSLVTAIR